MDRSEIRTQRIRKSRHRGHRQRRRQGGDQWEVHSCRAGDGSLAGGIS